MKRIIELPDDVVEAIQNGEDYRYDIHTAIAQSTPYNPSGDLISRSVLDEIRQLYKKYQPNLATEVIEFGNALEELIDNAQAVEYTFEEAFQKTVCENRLYCPARPKGECVDISKLRLMTVEECAGHTIDYAMGWKACIEWIKKGGAE